MRFANDKIAELVKYIQTPHQNRVRRSGDPYWYGNDERQWYNKQRQVFNAIAQDPYGDRVRTRDVVDALNLSDDETDKLYKFQDNKRNTVTRQVSYGVPHAQTGETVALQALQSSGVGGRLNNLSDPTATDIKLDEMIGNLNALMDVQLRIRPSDNDNLSLGMLMNMAPNVGTGAYRAASPGTTLGDIVEQAQRLSQKQGKRAHYDKVMHVQGNVAPDKVKDLIITGQIDPSRVSNLTRNRNHGNYDPMASDGLQVYDNNKLNKELKGMTKREFQSMGGEPLILPDKLKLQLPTERVLEIASPSQQYISNDTNEILQALYSGRL